MGWGLTVSAESDCAWWDLGCQGSSAVSSVVGSAVDNLADAVVEAVGRAMASLGTVWVYIGTPNLTDDFGTTDEAARPPASATSGVAEVLGYATWLALAVATLSLVGLGALLAVKIRAGEGLVGAGRIGLVLGAVVLVSAASALVTGLLPTEPQGVGGTVAFLQSSLWWYTGAAAVLSVLVGGARMAWQQRGEPGRELLRSLLTLIVVAGASVTVVGLLVTAADRFSVWLLDRSLDCPTSAEDSPCFGENMLALLALSSTTPAGLGSLLGRVS